MPMPWVKLLANISVIDGIIVATLYAVMKHYRS